MDIGDLKDAPYNPRVITDAAIKGLSNSISEFGDLGGIVWNKRTGFVVAGHQRIKALKERGAEFQDNPPRFVLGDKIFNIRVVDWEPDFEKAANIAANNTEINGVFINDINDILESIKELTSKMPDLRFNELQEKFKIPEILAPEDFNEKDENIETDKKCPKCGYEWS